MLPDAGGLFGLTVFVILIATAGKYVLRDGDTYWHVKAGRVMLESGEILRQDIFSHTAYGADWLAHEWLTEVVMAWVHDSFGLTGLCLLFFFLAAMTCNLLFKTASSLSSDGAALAALGMALPLFLTHLLARPHLFTWLFAAATLLILNRRDRTLWLLPPLTLLWANLHGGVLLGLVFQAAFVLGGLLDHWPGKDLACWRNRSRELRIPAVVLLLSTLAVAINPFGFRLFLLPLHVTQEVFRREILEWMPPDFSKQPYLIGWLIVLSGLMLYHFRRIPWAWRLLTVVLLYQAFSHIRYKSIAALATAPWVAMALHASRERLRGRAAAEASGPELRVSPWAGAVVTAALMIALAVPHPLRPNAWLNFAAKNYSLPEDYPAEAIDFLTSNGFPGKRLLNDYTYGGYLLYAFDTPPPVFIDGRADMYGPRVFSDHSRLIKAEGAIDELIHRYDIDWVLLRRESPLVPYLREQRNWRELSVKGQAAIFVIQD